MRTLNDWHPSPLQGDILSDLARRPATIRELQRRHGSIPVEQVTELMDREFIFYRVHRLRLTRYGHVACDHMAFDSLDDLAQKRA